MSSVRENRIRRKAARCGYRLSKSHRRYRAALDFGRYALLDLFTDLPIYGINERSLRHEWTLDQVEQYLTNGDGSP